MTPSFQILDLNQKVYGNFFIEASAGTGKTFTIAHLVLRLILEGPSPLSLKTVGVATFTKAAAAELKKRIKELFLEVKTNLEQGLPLPIYGLTLDTQEALERIKMALIDIESSPITTLHGLCFHILNKHALSLGLPLNLMNPEDASLEEMAYEFLKTTLRSTKLDHLILQKQKSALLAHSRGDFHHMILSLKEKILSPLNIQKLPSWEEIKLHIDSLINALPLYPGKECLQTELARYRLTPLTKEESQAQLEHLEEVLQKRKPTETLLVKKSFLEFLIPDRLKIKSASSDPKAASYLESLKKHLHPLLKQALDPVYIELTVARWCKLEFEKILHEKKILSFHSMLSLLDRLLDREELNKLINSEFEAMIIDEFQDTDPIQWSILKKLFIERPVKAFYMVGDPKQAIYTFRSADVYTYLKAKQTCPNLHQGTLNTCFRSTTPFIEALNHFLTLTSWIELPFQTLKLPYQPVASVKTTDLQQHPFSFYHLNLDLDETAQQMAQLAMHLNQLYPQDSVAILVKDRFQLEQVATSLKTYGAPFEALKNQTLAQSPVYTLLYQWLLILEEPLTQNVVHQFMDSMWMNLPLLEFNTLDPASILQTLASLKTCFDLHGLSTCLEALLQSPFDALPLRSKVASFYGIDLIDQLYSVAIQLEKSGHSLRSAKTLRIELEHLKKQAFKLPSIQLIKSPITLLTSHMSKGLEFDHVITLGIATRFKGSLTTVLKRIDDQLILGPYQQDDLSNLAIQDLDAEKLRQQYVAITRAKKTVHIPLINYKDDTLELGQLSPFELYLLKIAHKKASHKELYELAQTTDFNQIAHEYLQGPLFSHHLNVPTTSSSYHENRIATLNTQPPIAHLIYEQSLSFSSLKTESVSLKTDDPLKGRDFGDFFHLLMEELLISGRYLNVETPQTQNYLKDTISLTPFKEHSATIIDYIHQALNAPLQSQKGSFKLTQVPRSDLYIEEAFSYKIEQGLMKGFIDCVALFNNELILIDWKTTFLKDTTPKGLATHMKEASYLLQLEIYKKALEACSAYFKGCTLTTACYVFVKQGAVFTTNFQEDVCLI